MKAHIALAAKVSCRGVALLFAGDLASDRFIIYSTWRWLEARVETGEAPVYCYRPREGLAVLRPESFIWR